MLVMTVVLSLASASWECNYASEQWSEARLPAPCTVNSTAEAKTKWKLTDEQAACALAASRIPGKGSDESKQHAAWLACAMKWPDAWALVVGAIRTWDFRTDLSALVALLPVASAQQLLDFKNGRPTSLLLAHLVNKDPSLLLNLLQDQRVFDGDRAELPWNALRSGKAPTNDARFVNALLVGPLMEGRVFFAARTWLELPASVRTKFATDLDGLPLGGDSTDGSIVFGPDGGTRLVVTNVPSLRPLLVLGLMGLGEQAAAKSLALPPPLPAVTANHRLRELDLFSDAARWLVAGQRTFTTWDAALRMRVSTSETPWELWASLWPYLAPHDRLFKRQLGWRLKYADEAAARLVEGSSKSYGEAMLAANAAGLAALKRQVAIELPAERDAVTDGGVATLPAPFPSPFVEEATSSAKKANVVTKLEGDRSPRGFWIVRAEKQGKRLVALSMSQRLDPVGEVSPGAYWLSVSTDDGAHWRHVYLSLGQHRPFAALSESKVPLLDANDVVRLAMEEAPLDERSITFPPIAMRAPTKRPLVILKAKLSDLERDTDADGLSDLVEARLLLDWNKKDTDGDGVIDGDDATPRLDDRLKQTTLAEMYNVFFEHFLTGRRQPKALILAPNGKRGDLAAAMGTARTADLDDVRFLEGTPESLAGLRPLVRIVTVGPDELRALQERYGSFYPMHLEVTVEGPDHAFIEWSEGWRGGSCRIDRDAEGKLVVTSLGSWIT